MGDNARLIAVISDEEFHLSAGEVCGELSPHLVILHRNIEPAD